MAQMTQVSGLQRAEFRSPETHMNAKWPTCNSSLSKQRQAP